MRIRIAGTGSYVPEKVLTNNDLEKLVDTNDAWILERTGVQRRHISENETVTDMAVRAAGRAVKDAGIGPEDIDLIILSCFTGQRSVPCGACDVQKAIGAEQAMCFDLNAACSGFLIAWQTAQAYMEAGLIRRALLIGSEKLSRVTDWTDRSTCILFGDGAGAAVLEACEGPVRISRVHSDGRLGEALVCGDVPESGGRVRMDGQAVFRFAVKNVPEVIREVLDENGLKIEEVDGFLLHQANRRIIEAAARRLGADPEKFPMNLQEYGNTSSASIPILLDECRRNGFLKPGGTYVLAGFGGGLTWGAAVLDC